MLVKKRFSKSVTAPIKQIMHTGSCTAFVLLVALGIYSIEAYAQTLSTTDPVEQSMQRIELTIAPRVIEAERRIANPMLFRKIVVAEPVESNPTLNSSLLAIDTEKEIGKGGQLHISTSVRTRLTKYSDQFIRILSEEGVPPQLLSIALVESGFNQYALSPKGARGIWQFMPVTARRYGLPVGNGEDQRIHPDHSTRAAARYLRDLYQQFGDWKLAIAAYNVGEHKMQRIIDRTGIRSFEEMSRRGYLPLETRKYVPAVLAIWSRFAAKSDIQINVNNEINVDKAQIDVKALLKLGEPVIAADE
ncbi:MAG: lytic transglycosylase domain-containing protein [Acidobacteriota bacterium]